MDHFGSSKVKSDASVAPNRPLIKEKPNLRAAHAPFGRGSLWYTTACNSPTFCFMMHVPRDLTFSTSGVSTNADLSSKCPRRDCRFRSTPWWSKQKHERLHERFPYTRAHVRMSNRQPTGCSVPKIIANKIERLLRERITAGEWSATGRLASERHLAAEFGVARNTIRKAVNAIARDGILERRVGRGTSLGHAMGELATIL